MQKDIYFDNSATTQLRKEVLDEMMPFLDEKYGNPSSIYGLARTSKKAIEDARDTIAAGIGATSAEIFFTSGGTEANNWALRGVVDALKDKGNHIITSTIEHHAVLHVCEYLQKNGFEVTYIPVDKDGLVCVSDVEKAIRPSTILISIMFANNEIGTIQPIQEIAAVAKAHKVLFHTDAVQAIGRVPIDVKTVDVDLLTISGHKIYGPKGIGALYIRKGTRIRPLVFGGAQERNRRAGTENVAGIVGLGKAMKLILADMEEENKRLLKIRDELFRRILSEVPHVIVNGHREKRLPGNINVSVEFIEGESLLLLLDMKGIFCSSGSACTSGSLDPSHVLLALGLPHEKAHGSIRISLGRNNKDEDINDFMSEFPAIVAKLREMSPLYEDFVKNESNN